MIRKYFAGASMCVSKIEPNVVRQPQPDNHSPLFSCDWKYHILYFTHSIELQSNTLIELSANMSINTHAAADDDDDETIEYLLSSLGWVLPMDRVWHFSLIDYQSQNAKFEPNRSWREREWESWKERCLVPFLYAINIQHSLLCLYIVDSICR